jgi:hypothetical protein
MSKERGEGKDIYRLVDSLKIHYTEGGFFFNKLSL